MYCAQCGNRLNENDRFCGKCGKITSTDIAVILPMAETPVQNSPVPADVPKKNNIAKIIAAVTTAVVLVGVSVFSAFLIGRGAADDRNSNHREETESVTPIQDDPLVGKWEMVIPYDHLITAIVDNHGTILPEETPAELVEILKLFSKAETDAALYLEFDFDADGTVTVSGNAEKIEASAKQWIEDVADYISGDGFYELAYIMGLSVEEADLKLKEQGLTREEFGDQIVQNANIEANLDVADFTEADSQEYELDGDRLYFENEEVSFYWEIELSENEMRIVDSKTDNEIADHLYEGLILKRVQILTA